jgi:hypothetical protein
MFSIEQDSYLTSKAIFHYFTNDLANSFLTLVARNMSMFIPEITYVYVFWPPPIYASKSQPIDIPEITPYYGNQTFQFDEAVEDDDHDLLMALHKNGYK